MLRSARVTLALALLAGCDAPAPADDAGATRPPETIGPAGRPARLFTPPAHDGATALPLVVLLHGYTVNAQLQDLYFGLTRHARRDGYYALFPDGTIDADGEPHWDVLGRSVDDHAYLRARIEEARALVPVERVFVLGHSNGGFMAYRLACDSADLVAGIASLAGSDAVADCAPSADVAVLQIHGDADATVAYGGGTIAGLDYGAADATVAAWAARLGCTGTAEGARLDLVTTLEGAETRVLDHTGCRAGASLFTMEGGEHIPSLAPDFTPTVIGWLRAHAR
ncbi:MAG: hypothetical protein KF729_24315 [Sandaracinaceae bacterium]|nr:hypothetical protein [Sandaracinaceae bacterium]